MHSGHVGILSLCMRHTMGYPSLLTQPHCVTPLAGFRPGMNVELGIDNSILVVMRFDVPWLRMLIALPSYGRALLWPGGKVSFWLASVPLLSCGLRCVQRCIVIVARSRSLLYKWMIGSSLSLFWGLVRSNPTFGSACLSVDRSLLES